MSFFFSTTALCISLLRDLGVTAVVNAAQGSMTGWNYVNTRQSYYTNTCVKDFLGIAAVDLKHYPIQAHFDQASDFMDKVLKANG